MAALDFASGAVLYVGRARFCWQPPQRLLTSGVVVGKFVPGAVAGRRGLFRKPFRAIAGCSPQRAALNLFEGVDTRTATTRARTGAALEPF